MTTFKVKEVSKYISNVLRRDSFLSNISVEGEVSNFKKSGGHSYFSIKDDEAMLKCVVFKTIPIAQSLNLTDGQKVVVTGTVMTYEKGSYYQILCKNVEEVGRGNLYEQFLALKEKLSKEGLFNSELKKPIPKFPKNIGVVTAKNGAAIRDILNTLRRRYRIANIYFYPAKVQGIGASDEIALGVKYLDSLDFIDTIIVGRGGGSFEDLNAFNDENLIRTIFNCKKPVISAVGHEIDTMLTDYVADKRAATPTAGAELSSVSMDEIKEFLNQAEKKLNKNILEEISAEKVQLEHFKKELEYYNPANRITTLKENLENLKKSLDEKIVSIFKYNKQLLDFKRQSLEIINPNSILDRGYSIIYNDKNEIVKDIKTVNVGDSLKLKVSNGEIISDVKEIIDGN
ncbi:MULTISPECIES: exodeoxyribonuclease VII large subunit [Parvimonas]|uniref:Exodeoxyribonuclease 7 large subunit n=2 Tax=Parvimonas micra TaxID=33033 RepID=A0A3B7DMU9_9FIRM|nr:MULTISPECIES: exodeoxyribonuclease VII large subunit [Parvimonas]AXU10728.1 exodeoxyribonuclease VII large subunit [Parvimonas micra]EDP23283.1 exodeoxyribonuclease VII, large subunit [Parvimonas micra ATCC 33270]MBF1307087.1 exodeoxyribonuclease VII large subunit [Parvimonas micra]MCK6130792.1 exodeoxyribonuclease VII large subunit [Parvimonas micra]MCK6136437.1 exodeoxyribonuclease VII large subunit [Parvimonas micra]